MKKFAALSTVAALSIALAACGKSNDQNSDANAVDNTTTANEVGSVDNGAMSGNDMNAANGSAAMPMTAQAFADAASASDAYEIASSKLAETKAKDAGVKSFAADMIKDHTKSTADLKAAAAKSTEKVTPAGTMTADQQGMMTQLQGLSGADFDKEYARQQVNAHQMTLAALQGYASGGDSTHLKAFARNTAPVVQHHLDMARKLAK